MAGGRGVRSLILLLIGLAIGVICTGIVMNALSRETAYSKGVMAVMGAQMKALDKSVKANRCTANDLLPRFQTLRAVANDIEPAFTPTSDDDKFGHRASDLRAAEDAALLTPLTTCANATAAIHKIGDTCGNCHQDFRN
jgi:cytochrome c556